MLKLKLAIMNFWIIGVEVLNYIDLFLNVNIGIWMFHSLWYICEAYSARVMRETQGKAVYVFLEYKYPGGKSYHTQKNITKHWTS